MDRQDKIQVTREFLFCRAFSLLIHQKIGILKCQYIGIDHSQWIMNHTDGG